MGQQNCFPCGDKPRLTSLSKEDAKANAKPANEASMVGVSTATKAVMPMTALESRLNRADNQRFTIGHREEQLLEHP